MGGKYTLERFSQTQPQLEYDNIVFDNFHTPDNYEVCKLFCVDP